MKKKFEIEGMTCAACVNAVEKAVKKIDPEIEVNVSLMTHSMDVKSDKEIDSDTILKAVENAGYGALEKKQKKEKRVSPKEIIEKDLLKLKNRLKISIPLMVLLMYIAMGHMMYMPYPDFFTKPENAGIFIFTQFLISIPILFTNRNYFINGFKALRHKNPNMDSLVSLGSIAGVIYGIFTIYMISYALGRSDMKMVHKYMHDIYFETSTMILTLITFGKYLEAKSKSRTTDSINKLIDIQPDFAIVVNDGAEIEIPIEELKKGDIIKIIPGERIAVDGVVKEGSSSVDQSAITGESIPVEVGKGSRVISGSINKNGAFLMEATNVGDETTISKIITLMEEASATKAPISQLADKVSGVFVPIVMSISAISFLTWFIMGYGLEFSFSIAIGVLVISCPCALGLATPVAMMVATGKAADSGILVKSQDALENLHKMDVMIFDKTGTITEGRPIVTDIITINDYPTDRALEIALSIENNSQQPLADAIVNYSRENGYEVKSISDFEAIDGKGVSARVEDKIYFIGNTKLMKDVGIEYSHIEKITNEYSNQGKTAVYMFDKESVILIFAIADKIKDSSIEAISQIKKFGMKTVMLTGDNKLTARNMAQRAGVDSFEAELLPQDKDRIVRKYMENAKVCMVGDGINDAPALMRADIGIAIADGTDIAIDSADLVLMKSNLQDIVNSIKLSKRTLGIIRENLFWAFFYNILAIPVAMGVFYLPFGLKLNPMFGAFAMSLSSVFVVTNSLRIKNFKIQEANRETGKNSESKVKISNININIKNQKIEEKKMKKILTIEGMTCNHCKMRVEKILKGFDAEVEVSLEEKTATVTADHELNDAKLKSAIDEAGYEVVSIK